MPEDSGGRTRAMIDRGRTGDKIPGYDPSAAPHGSDAEASGMPTAGGFTGHQAVARHDEAQAKSLPGAVPHANSGLAQPRSAMPWLVVWSLIIIGALAIVLAALQT